MNEQLLNEISTEVERVYGIQNMNLINMIAGKIEKDESFTEAINLKAIIMKLIGAIEPVGETHTDNKRFENLEKLTALTLSLLCDICDVGDNADSGFHSKAMAGKHALKFLNSLVDEFDLKAEEKK